MESESSGTPDDGEGWDDATSHEEMTCNHNDHHLDSYFDTSQEAICETFDDRDTMCSDEEERESSNAIERCLETPTGDVSNEATTEEIYFSPSYVCEDLSSVFSPKDLSPDSIREHLGSAEDTLRFHNCEVDEESPSAEYCDLIQDVGPASTPPEEQVVLHYITVAPSSFLNTFMPLF